MNNELIKKAYEHFNGVWPDGATHIATTSPSWYGVGAHKGDMHAISAPLNIKIEGRNVVSSFCVSEDSLVIACTKDEFESYRNRLKHRYTNSPFASTTPVKFEPKPWAPEVGQECGVAWGMTPNIWGSAIYIGDYFLFEIKEGEFRKTNIEGLKNLRFRPIKTEREKQIDELCLIIAGAWGKQTSSPTDLSPIAEDILNAGFQKTTDK